MRVLVVEDEQVLADAVATGLRRESMAVDVVYDGDAALERISVNDYDVVVLDRDLPLVHGDDVCRHVVSSGLATRVLMLTAAGDVQDRVDGLTLGADDYLAKPFAFPELIARIRALGRRAVPALPPVLERSGLRLDPSRREVSPHRPAGGAVPQGVLGPGGAAARRRRRRELRAAAGEGLGRERRPLHQRRARDGDDAAA